jgi:chemotaxis protein CheD
MRATRLHAMLPAELATAGPLEPVQVRIGELRVACAPAVLFSVGLGSCVAVALWDRAARVAGLAHVMLPQAPGSRSPVFAGRYAALAVPRLVELMRAEGGEVAAMRARIAGGASMFRGVLEGEGLRLGRRNVEAVREALEQAAVPIEAEDVFGMHGRSVFLRAADGALLVTSAGGPGVYL